MTSKTTPRARMKYQKKDYLGLDKFINIPGLVGILLLSAN